MLDMHLKLIENVRIVAGITYELNIELTTDFTLDEIVVVDRKFFEEKSTNTVKVIDSDQISRLPVEVLLILLHFNLVLLFLKEAADKKEMLQ